jgi:hypothetical protein
MTTGSEAAAMAGAPQFCALRGTALLYSHDIHHMMRRKICNGGWG